MTKSHGSAHAGDLIGRVQPDGRNLDLTVVVEGVETETQAEFLRKVGCHRAQGYYFSYPLDVDSFEAFVR